MQKIHHPHPPLTPGYAPLSAGTTIPPVAPCLVWSSGRCARTSDSHSLSSVLQRAHWDRFLLDTCTPLYPDPRLHPNLLPSLFLLPSTLNLRARFTRSTSTPLTAPEPPPAAVTHALSQTAPTTPTTPNSRSNLFCDSPKTCLSCAPRFDLRRDPVQCQDLWGSSKLLRHICTLQALSCNFSFSPTA